MTTFSLGLSGTGTVWAYDHARVQINGPVGSGQTIRLDSSVLEFVQPPKMSFLGKVTDMSSVDTILIDHTLVKSAIFRSISQAGNGLGELALIDSNDELAGRMLLVGHFTSAEFTVASHVRPESQGGNWSAINFRTLPLSPWVMHS